MVYSRGMASKRTVMIGAIAGMTVGGMLPMLFGDNNPFDIWSTLGTLVGGCVGIWLTVKLGRYFGD